MKKKNIKTKPETIARSESVLKVSSDTKKTSKLLSFVKSILILAVIFGLLYYFRSLFVVAVVNGKPITRLEVIKELEARDGNAVLDELITVRVIEGEAEKMGISVAESEITAEQEKINSSLVEQGTTLEEALASSGQTMENARKSFRIQKLVEKILEGKLGVTDSDVEEYYNTYKETFEGATFEEVKEDLKEQLSQQKLGVEFEKWITEVKGNSRVIFFKDFN